MELIYALIITAILTGLPTWLIIRAVKKADQNTIVYSPEEVSQKLQKGFFLSQWGLEFSYGSVLSFILIFCDIHIVIMFLIPICSVTVGLILFFIGRFQIGMTTRYFNFCNREKTETEEWVVKNIQKVERQAAKAHSIHTLSKLTPTKTDDVLASLSNKDIITGFNAVGNLYTGKNILKKHWPIISIILSILLSILYTIAF